MPLPTLLALLVLLVGPPAWARPARPAPPLARPTGTIVEVDSEPGLQAAVRGLRSNTTILIAPGTYTLTSTLSVRGPLTDVAIRGTSANADDVVLVGPGMRNEAYGATPFGIWTGDGVNGITIANLTIRELYYHPIILNGGTQRPRIYNVHLVNAGQQFIKSNPDEHGAGASNGILEYSVIEFTTPPRDNYPKGIDIHGGSNWTIRHNLFRNLVTGPGDILGPAVLVWRGSAGTVTEGNTFINCARGVMYGADNTPEPSHRGGIIRNNVFIRTASQPGDVGIMLTNSPGTVVAHNTVLLSGTYPNGIEYRYPGTTGATLVNNLTDAAITARDGGMAWLDHNVEHATGPLVVSPQTGDAHLSARATAAIDRGVPTEAASDDWDGQRRPQGAAPDVGADERRPAGR